MSKVTPIKITKEQTKTGMMINSFQATLKRMSNLLGYGVSPDGKRDYNQIFGYGSDLTYTDFFGMYKRNAIGNAVVTKVTKACWNEIPKIMSGETQVLEDELDQLSKQGFFKALQRADILNRIGPFSVLLIGMPDGMDLNTPINKASDIQGLYFNPYNFDGIEIMKWDREPDSKRFGLPVLYQLRTTNHGDKKKEVNTSSIVAHYSRIIHLAEGSLDSSIEGCSSLEPVWNSLINILKVTGGAGEAFFRNARTQRALSVQKDATIKKDSEALKTLDDNLDAFDNGWSNTLRLNKMDVTHLPVQMIDPRESFDINVEETSGQTGIPIRVLTGKGGGQVTGKEDRASWNSLIFDRRADECDGYLMQGLEIMSEAGLFELPDDAVIEWPPLASLNESEASEVNERKAKTFDAVITAFGKVGGDEANIKTVLEAVGLEDIEINDIEIDDKETDSVINPDEDLDNE